MKRASLYLVVVAFCILGCSEASITEKPAPTLPEAIQTTPQAHLTESAPPATLILFNESTARYLVQEQLARLNFPIDAVGETKEVSGQIVIGEDGLINREDSKIIVKLKSLRSDESRRDRYLQNNSLESNIYPEAVFQINELIDFAWPDLGNKQKSFRILGEMTIHGITAPIEWNVDAHFENDIISGQAKTTFPFSKFEMDIPSLFFILSVEDEIRLELDFSAAIKTKP